MVGLQPVKFRIGTIMVGTGQVPKVQLTKAMEVHITIFHSKM